MKILSHTLLLLFLCSVSSLRAQLNTNLLANPGAEAGTLASWTSGGDSNPFVDNGSFDPGINPHTGSYDFVGGSGDLGTLSQTVSLASISSALIDSGAAEVMFGFWEQSLPQGNPSDDVFISLTFLDGSNNVLGTINGPEIDSQNAWQQFSDTDAVPSGTRSITYTMNFVRHSGSDNDGFADDNLLEIIAVPEPSSAAAFVAGLALLVVFARARVAGSRRRIAAAL